MKTLVQLFTVACLASLALQAQPAITLDEPLFGRLRAEAARTHPAAAAGTLRATAAAQDVGTVRLWNDPMIGLGFMAADRAMRADNGDIIVGLEQALPKPGMYAAQRRKAEATHRAELENSRTATLAVGAEAVRSAIEVALADESIRLQQAQLDWLAAMAENASQMAADPMGSSIDALRLKTELLKEQQVLAAANRSREGLARKLNLALGRPLDSPWPALKLPDKPPPVPVAPAEIARIPHANPKVRAMTEMVSAANAETRIADRERLPEVSVGVDTNTYTGGDFRSAVIGMKLTLPWFHERPYQAKIDAARSRELAAGRDVETMRREIATSVLAAATEAANAAHQARAWAGEIHAQALQTTRTIEAAWISSKAPLTDLLDANRTLFSIRLEQRRFIAMEFAALEELHILVPRR